MTHACIFDLDGTLINSLEDLADSSNYALKKLGYPVHPVEAYRYFVGRGVPKLTEDILPEAARTPEILKKTRAYFDEYYSVHSLDHTASYPGIRELLHALRGRGLKLAVVSNKPDGFVKELVEKIFPGVFDTAVGQRDGVPRKPDPASVFETCRELGVSNADCVYLGDSGVDMLTANAAKIFAVGVLWGFRSRQELVENGANAVIESPGELLAILDGASSKKSI